MKNIIKAQLVKSHVYKRLNTASYIFRTHVRINNNLYNDKINLNERFIGGIDMFKKDFTIVISNENTSENYKKLFTILGKYRPKVKENKDVGWLIIKLKASRAQWQMIVGKLKKEMDLSIHKIDNYWFI